MALAERGHTLERDVQCPHHRTELKRPQVNIYGDISSDCHGDIIKINRGQEAHYLG